MKKQTLLLTWWKQEGVWGRTLDCVCRKLGDFDGMGRPLEGCRQHWPERKQEVRVGWWRGWIGKWQPAHKEKPRPSWLHWWIPPNIWTIVNTNAWQTSKQLKRRELLIPWDLDYHPDSQVRQRQYKKITDWYLLWIYTQKFSANTSKPNPATYRKGYPPGSHGIHPRNAGWFGMQIPINLMHHINRVKKKATVIVTGTSKNIQQSLTAIPGKNTPRSRNRRELPKPGTVQSM